MMPSTLAGVHIWRNEMTFGPMEKRKVSLRNEEILLNGKARVSCDCITKTFRFFYFNVFDGNFMLHSSVKERKRNAVARGNLETSTDNVRIVERSHGNARGLGPGGRGCLSAVTTQQQQQQQQISRSSERNQAEGRRHREPAARRIPMKMLQSLNALAGKISPGSPTDSNANKQQAQQPSPSSQSSNGDQKENTKSKFFLALHDEYTRRKRSRERGRRIERESGLMADS
ncbi:hypothetical protein WN51_12869 [Melipona quadrifasciata]|uniref:Uncharacterized protein n=1 Tax=Melipona quadrifasciata TaxID=166423 RepID=A0A0M9A416_9HYME|nr:hypothetical protein WN51_12869 [Melipona quadrifasciata]